MTDLRLNDIKEKLPKIQKFINDYNTQPASERIPYDRFDDKILNQDLINYLAAIVYQRDKTTEYYFEVVPEWTTTREYLSKAGTGELSDNFDDYYVDADELPEEMYRTDLELRVVEIQWNDKKPYCIDLPEFKRIINDLVAEQLDSIG